MELGRGLILAFGVLLLGQQALLGQLLTGHSEQYSRTFNSTSPTMGSSPEWKQPTQQPRVGGPDEWENYAATPIYNVSETESTAWGHPTSIHSCAQGDSECSQFWNHRTAWFGDFLYITARDVDQAYATHVDGPIATAVPVGPTAVVDSSYQPGFRIGRVHALDHWSSIRATYWYYQSDASDSLNLPGGTGWLRPEVTHPATLAADFDKLSATADYEIDLQMIDLAYRKVWREACDYSISYAVGVRYGHLEQDFRSEFTVLGVRTVDTDIKFDGVGPRVGLEGERLLSGGFVAYGQAFGNLLAGKFSANYAQQSNLAGAEATAGFDDRRFVPQLELELGLRWQDSCGNFRIRAGYYVGAWFNIATTPTWIDAVQANSITEVDETLIFDGLAIRAEYRF